MRLEIQFFLFIVIVYIFMGLVLQVVNLFMPSDNIWSKGLNQICSLKAADLFKNV